jgi:hypothetical protein
LFSEYHRWGHLASDYFMSSYVDLHPVRNMYLISNTLWTNNSMIVKCALGIIKNNPATDG